jgi:hypothetical protein
MKLTVTILAGAHRTDPRDRLVGPYLPPTFDQPGDLVVSVTAEDLHLNMSMRLLLADMLREAEQAVSRMLKPVTHTGEVR